MTPGLLVLLAQIAAASPPTAAIRFNQLGYLPDAPKVAVFCALTPIDVREFVVSDATGKQVLRRNAVSAKRFGPCTATYRLDFSSIRASGTYRVDAAGVMATVRVRKDAY